VSCGTHYNNHNRCYLNTDGEVYCWGYGGDRTLGQETDSGNKKSPVKVHGSFGDEKIESIHMTGPGNYCAVFAIDSIGDVYTWGYNDHDNCVVDHVNDRHQAYSVRLGTVSQVKQIASSGEDYLSTCFLMENKKVICQGSNHYGQLGVGYTGNSCGYTNPPKYVIGLNNVSSIYGFYNEGKGGFCAITENGSLKCWGNNSHGQLGYPSNMDRITSPQEVPNLHYYASEFQTEEIGWFSESGAYEMCKDGKTTKVSYCRSSLYGEVDSTLCGEKETFSCTNTVWRYKNCYNDVCYDVGQDGYVRTAECTGCKKLYRCKRINFCQCCNT
jgi:hypothetical protein